MEDLDVSLVLSGTSGPFGSFSWPKSCVLASVGALELHCGCLEHQEGKTKMLMWHYRDHTDVKYVVAVATKYCCKSRLTFVGGNCRSVRC